MLSSDPHTLFISDLHLCASRPHTTKLLLEFLAGTARGAQTLYILGDLFEYWAGDDDVDDPQHLEVVQALKLLSDNGARIGFMHGNRDFLIAREFASKTGATLLGDPFVTEIHGRRALLTHGDTLCTDDVEYQKFRQQVRDNRWQQVFLAQPLSTRKAQIEALRMQSETEKSRKPEAIMDVNQEAVRELLRQHDYPELLIHGHTHRPGRHAVEIDGHHSTRWVLGDWDITGNYLRCDAAGMTAHTIHS